MTEKIKVDVGDLTLSELADAGELLGVPLHQAMDGMGQPKAIAAIVCIVQRRTDPEFGMEQALRLHMRDVELVGADPEAPAGSNGGAPVLLPASGS